MPKADDRHFDGYTEQTRAKHRILCSYLPAYLTALKSRATRFHYIDGFAGKGMYAGNMPGSPVLALDIIGASSVAGITSTSFVESKDDYFRELEGAVLGHQALKSISDAPLLRRGRFDAHVDEILGRPVYQGNGRTATFAFIDPCGVEGVRMADLIRILQLDYGELLLFFNYDGVNRIMGGIEAGTHDNRVLLELLGTEDAVSELEAALRRAKCPSEREMIIRDHFVGIMKRRAGVQYFVPFRVEARTTDRASHYLVHCCRHALGFKMMKHVMRAAGRELDEQYGKLEFLNDAERGKELSLFRMDIEERKQMIGTRIAQNPCQVSEFTVDWVCKPSDAFCEADYKRMLLEMESKGQLLVFDEANVLPVPAVSRRTHKGAPTLGPKYWLRPATN